MAVFCGVPDLYHGEAPVVPNVSALAGIFDSSVRGRFGNDDSVESCQ